MRETPVVVMVGPTAVGKSRVALRLAELVDGEIVSADSRQVYWYMDIGTAKPTLQERARIPHHLINIVDPDQEFTLVHYKTLATAAISNILSREKVPLLVGGTGLYVRAVTEGLAVPLAPPNAALRRRLEQLSETQGSQALYKQLALVDPEAARRIHPKNTRRVIRALEVWHHTGQPISRLQEAQTPPFSFVKVGLTIPRDALYLRIDKRVDQMLEAGLVEEVRGLVDRGYAWDLPSMSGLGYRQIGQYLRGEVDLAKAVQRMKYETHRFARQQYTWFRQDDPRIHWFSVTDDYNEVVETVAQELKSMVLL